MSDGDWKVKLTHFGVNVALIVTGIVVIGIASWQYQSDNSNGATITYIFDGHTYNGMKSICDQYPFYYMRPYSFTIKGSNDIGYCGYSAQNTGYRLTLGCLSFLLGIALFLKKDLLQFLDWISLIFSMLWFSALVADGMAMTQGSYTCDKQWEGKYASCDSSSYGVTIALDTLLFIFLLFCWYIARLVLQGHRDTPKLSGSEGNTA